MLREEVLLSAPEAQDVVITYPIWIISMGYPWDIDINGILMGYEWDFHRLLIRYSLDGIHYCFFMMYQWHFFMDIVWGFPGTGVPQ